MELLILNYQNGTTHTGACDKELLIQSYYGEILTPSHDGDADRKQLMQIHWYRFTDTELPIASSLQRR